jgi:hypothetical protein
VKELQSKPLHFKYFKTIISLPCERIHRAPVKKPIYISKYIFSSLKNVKVMDVVVSKNRTEFHAAFSPTVKLPPHKAM